MFDLTAQEKQVALFILIISCCGITLNYMAKFNHHAKKLIYPEAHLALIDLNKVSPEELMNIGRLPSKISQRIIAYRQQRGSFRSLEELKEVKGIGHRRYEKLKEVFFVE